MLHKLQHSAVTKSALWLSVMNVITLKLTAIIVFRKQRQKLELVSFKALYNARGKKAGVGKSCNGGQVGRRGTVGGREGG